jgi:phosphomannomutase
MLFLPVPVRYTITHMTMTFEADYRRAFKDADIRGIYPTEIDEETVYFIARAFVEEFKYTKVLVARDMRLSTPRLHEAFMKGVVDSGASVIDIGMVHTPVLYYASGSLDLPGVMITASHSPKEHNGLKLVFPKAIPLTEKNGLGKIRRRMERGKFAADVKPGKITKKDVLKKYQKSVLVGVSVKKLNGLNVIADVGNGMASVLMSLLQEKLPINFTLLFPELDGRFPNRGSDPTLSKNQRQLKKALKEGSYDFGVGFDGDGDRISFSDEQGNFINSAVIGALLAEQMLKKHKGAKIGYTNLDSLILLETIKRCGGKPVPVRVGHAFIKETMRKKDVLFAAEHSGHFYFKDYFYTDSVTLPLLGVLEVYTKAKAEGMTFSEMMKPYVRYQQTEDVIVMVKDRELALEKTRAYVESLRPQTIETFDGFFVNFGDVWGSVKISVTEYALKLMFEGKKMNDAQMMQDKVVEFIRSVADEEL